MIPDTEEHPEWVMCPNCGEILEDEDAEEGELCCRCESELIHQNESSCIYDHLDTSDYWCGNQSQLKAGMVFVLFDDSIVKLDYRVPGDGTQWRVATWLRDHWSYEEGTIEPGDLKRQILAYPD